jgi:2-methylcitrate dehydratase PrpD
VIPPALAIAERDGATGRDLLTAIALGAEVAVRLAAGLNYSVAGKLGWHFPGIVGPFGAAAAVGRLRGLSELQMRNAFGIAGSQSAGTWASWGSPTVKFHQARGAVSGLVAALLAEQDFKASAEIIAHKDGGMLVAYSDGGKPEAILEGLGSHFEFERLALRLWLGGTPLQPAMTAAFDLVAAEKPNFRAIDRVRIAISEDVYKAHARFNEPKGTFEALLSFEFTVGSMLREGGLWLDSVSPGRIGDPDLRRFMRERMELVADPSLTREQSAVEVVMNDGRKLSVRADAAKGTTRNPATLEDLSAKFRRCAEDRLSADDAAELLDLLVRIDEVQDLKRLFALLGSAGQAGAARGRTNAA